MTCLTLPYLNTHSGNEASLITNFKDALGLENKDAAAVHIDVGRRVLRSRIEAGSRNEDIEARKVRTYF